MSKTWTTNLQRLLIRGVSDTDILMVKLLTLDNYDGTMKVSMGIYPARLIHKGTKIEWHINDYLDDFLIIDTDDVSAELGRTDVDESLTHIIIGCYVLKHRSPCDNYIIVDKKTDAVITTAETKREADVIKRALISQKISVNISKKYTRNT